jgi:hypothetical protein
MSGGFYDEKVGEFFEILEEEGKVFIGEEGKGVINA